MTISDRSIWCSMHREMVGTKRYWCPRCECGKTRPVEGLDCGCNPPRCFVSWCERYQQEMEPRD